MQFTLDYGRTGLTVEIPDAHFAGSLDLAPVTALTDPQAELNRVLATPTGTPSLASMAQGKQSACILICDITRPVPNELILTGIVRTLEEAGVPREGILILIATGLHRPNVGDELVELVGELIASNYRVENHDGQCLSDHTYLGDSPRGVPAWIDSRYLAADLKIATGLIEPHFMAGYSGGRKLICPGIAALETVKVWHGPKFLEHPLATSGELEGNPVHEENTHIARMAGCDFIVNVTLDKDRNVTSIVAGDLELAFQQGVKFVADIVKSKLDQPADVVVTSSAGYPLDTTFYQSIKGLVGALAVVREGGTVIVAASLSEGIGSPEFSALFEEHADIDAFMQAILGDDYFVMDQWQLEEMAKACRKVRIIYVTDGLSKETLEGLFVEAAPSVEDAIADCLDQYGEHTRIAIIPKGPYVLPTLEPAI